MTIHDDMTIKKEFIILLKFLGRCYKRVKNKKTKDFFAVIIVISRHETMVNHS